MSKAIKHHSFPWEVSSRLQVDVNNALSLAQHFTLFKIRISRCWTLAISDSSFSFDAILPFLGDRVIFHRAGTDRSFPARSAGCSLVPMLRVPEAQQTAVSRRRCQGWGCNWKWSWTRRADWARVQRSTAPGPQGGAFRCWPQGTLYQGALSPGRLPPPFASSISPESARHATPRSFFGWGLPAALWFSSASQPGLSAPFLLFLDWVPPPSIPSSTQALLLPLAKVPAAQPLFSAEGPRLPFSLPAAPSCSFLCP